MRVQKPKERVLSMGFMHVPVHPLGLVNKQNTGIWCRFESVINIEWHSTRNKYRILDINSNGTIGLTLIL